jgi:hypothetical protein
VVHTARITNLSVNPAWKSLQFGFHWFVRKSADHRAVHCKNLVEVFVFFCHSDWDT